MNALSKHLSSTGIPNSATDLNKICTSLRWQRLMLSAMPFADHVALLSSAEQAFQQLTESDWLEAFAGHPMIGDISTLEKKYGAGKALSEAEQQQVAGAPKTVLEQLLLLNHQYKERFGFIFIICATGQSAQAMVTQLKERIGNSYAQELSNAATEQRKISLIRMEACS